MSLSGTIGTGPLVLRSFFNTVCWKNTRLKVQLGVKTQFLLTKASTIIIIIIQLICFAGPVKADSCKILLISWFYFLK